MGLKSFDLRLLKRFTSPQAVADLNVFLEKMPQTAGQTVLIAAGIAWSFAAAVGLYTAVQTKNLIDTRAELRETEALKPIVPKVGNVPVSPAAVKHFTANMKKSYPDLRIKQQGAAIYITSSSTVHFGQFREAVGHVQNGGAGWRVSVDRLCVGRECKQSKLAALLKINKVSVDKPK